jgi:hypothetical protein
MDEVTNLYLYRTARDDGMQFCVGANFRTGPADGMVALFQTHHAAMVFMEAMSHKYGMAIQVLPSAEVAA